MSESEAEHGLSSTKLNGKLCVFHVVDYSAVIRVTVCFLVLCQIRMTM